MPKVRWERRISFVANFVRFPAVQTLWESVKIWQNYREFKVWNFFETQCSTSFIKHFDNPLRFDKIREFKGGNFLRYNVVDHLSLITSVLQH